MAQHDIMDEHKPQSSRLTVGFILKLLVWCLLEVLGNPGKQVQPCQRKQTARAAATNCWMDYDDGSADSFVRAQQ